ncbi:MAG: DUF58 domain-containing protein [Desulfuromonadales bacterium]|nr:DUF58 domain-containing protein [Chloroflexota bacterium]MCK4621744.1 DUF58 domain-containing protein [Desulfuromonadales bacterium]
MKLTRAGILYIALTLLLGFAAVNTGNNLLYLLVSALLGFMAVSGLLGQRNLQRLSVYVSPPREVFSGNSAAYDVELSNHRRWLPAFLMRVEVGAEGVLFPLLAAQESSRQALLLTFSERGFQSLPTVRLTSCFPINFFVRSKNLEIKQQVLVFPRPQIATLASGAGDHHRVGHDALTQPGIDGELRSIDNYRETDPLKSIHWKLSARHDEFKVKRQNRFAAPSTLLDLQNFDGPLEERLGKCTFLVDQLVRQQQAVGLQLDRQLIPPGQGAAHRHKLLTELALYGQR